MHLFALELGPEFIILISLYLLVFSGQDVKLDSFNEKDLLLLWMCTCIWRVHLDSWDIVVVLHAKHKQHDGPCTLYWVLSAPVLHCFFETFGGADEPIHFDCRWFITSGCDFTFNQF